MDSSINTVTGVLSSFSLPISDATSAKVSSVVVDLSELDSSISVLSGRRKIDISPGFYFAKVSGEMLSLEGVRLSLQRDPNDGAINFSALGSCVLASDVEGARAGSDFVEWLNRQSFKALLEGGISYLDGRYYSVALPSQQGFQLTESVLGRQFIAVDELQADGLTEKGAPDSGAFAANSVFRILDNLRYPTNVGDSPGIRRMKGELIDVDVVLCTDMGTEAADFIFSSPHKLIYVHAKCGRSLQPRSSAGALAEVGSQALKNVEQLISKDLTLKFGNESRLKELWPDASDRLAFTRLRSSGMKVDRRSRVQVRVMGT